MPAARVVRLAGLSPLAVRTLVTVCWAGHRTRLVTASQLAVTTARPTGLEWRLTRPARRPSEWGRPDAERGDRVGPA